VALAVGADGVHLGGGSVPADVARRLVGPGALIGVSTHAPGEAPADADLAFFGPVYATPSKGGAQGETRLAEAVRAATIPVRASPRWSPSSTCSRSPTVTCWSCRARTRPRSRT